MRRPTRPAFATVPPEELLLDYVRRLARHRGGRRAVHLMLSRLTRAYRHLEDLRAAEGPFRSLLERHEGELICLRNGDLVCCTKAPRAELDAAVLRVLYMMRDDRNLRAAIKRGDEDGFLCRWYDLDRDYDTLLTFARSLAADPARPPQPSPVTNAAGSDPEPAPSAGGKHGVPASTAAAKTETPMPPGSAVALPKAVLRRPIDANRFAMLERSLETADISRFLTTEPIAWLNADGRRFQTRFYRYGIDYDALARVTTPGFDLTAEPWFHRRLAYVLAKRLLSLELPLPQDGKGDPVVELSLDCIRTEAFEHALRRRGTVFSGKMIAAFSAFEVYADPTRYLDILRGLHERGLRCAVTGFDIIQFAMRESALLPADLEILPWHAIASLETADRDRVEAFMRAVRRRGPERVILAGCRDSRAIAAGRELGIRHFCGDRVSEALKD